MIEAKDKPRQDNTRIWRKPGKNPKSGKTLDQFFLLCINKCSAKREREYNDFKVNTELPNRRSDLRLQFRILVRVS